MDVPENRSIRPPDATVSPPFAIPPVPLNVLPTLLEVLPLEELPSVVLPPTCIEEGMIAEAAPELACLPLPPFPMV